MQQVVDKYFSGHRQNPTVHGLTLALDFKHRSSLLDDRLVSKEYGEAFCNIIRRARLRIAAAYERDIRDKKKARGCVFALNAMFDCAEQRKEEIRVPEAIQVVMWSRPEPAKTAEENDG